jgi:hypothetical protein
VRILDGIYMEENKAQLGSKRKASSDPDQRMQGLRGIAQAKALLQTYEKALVHVGALRAMLNEAPPAKVASDTKGLWTNRVVELEVRHPLAEVEILEEAICKFAAQALEMWVQQTRCDARSSASDRTGGSDL